MFFLPKKKYVLSVYYTFSEEKNQYNYPIINHCKSIKSEFLFESFERSH